MGEQERYEGHGNLDLTLVECRLLAATGFEHWGSHGWIRDDENGDTCYDDKWAMREALGK